MSGTERVEIGPADDIGPDDREIVTIDGREIGVFNVDGEYYALLNTCPHARGPVCQGSVRGVLEADWPGPGERVREGYGETPAIACPWHGWEFDMESGQHVGDPERVLPTFDVVVDEGTLYLEL